MTTERDREMAATYLQNTGIWPKQPCHYKRTGNDMWKREVAALADLIASARAEEREDLCGWLLDDGRSSDGSPSHENLVARIRAREP